jgi:transposase
MLIAEKSREELVEINGKLADQVAQLEAKVAWFEEQFRLAKHRRFGSSSEQTPVPEQPSLFNEAEALADPQAPEPTVETITYERRKKAKGYREAQLADLPVEEIEYRLPEDEQVCTQCSGPLHEMGCDERQELKIVPAQVSVVKHLCFKYACRRCQVQDVTTPILSAQMPRPAFPNSLASPSAVAHIMTQKFVMGAPLYRQEAQLANHGLSLSRQTMANWMIKGAEWFEAIYDRLHEVIVTHDGLHADETTLQVLKEPGRDAKTDSYMWLYRTGRIGPPIVLFEYQQTRGSKHPKRFLEGYRGFLHVDGYVGYDGLPPEIVLLCCWAHARRKFDEAVKALLTPTRKAGGTASHAGLDFCNQLFKVESDLRDATPEERYAARLERSKPILDSFKTWLDEQALRVLPKCALGSAIGYCLNQWTKLNAFLLDGRLEIDNNRAERSIKPFVIGRKNWLFANTPRGATASAVIYSIIETAKENNLNPSAYLEHLFETLPGVDPDDLTAIDRLLPWSEMLPDKVRKPGARD